MIKIINPKPLSEINELRSKGLYNAPFAVLESIDKVVLNGIGGAGSEELAGRVDELEVSQAELVVELLEEIAMAEERNAAAIVELMEELMEV